MPSDSGNSDRPTTARNALGLRDINTAPFSIEPEQPEFTDNNHREDDAATPIGEWKNKNRKLSHSSCSSLDSIPTRMPVEPPGSSKSFQFITKPSVENVHPLFSESTTKRQDWPDEWLMFTIGRVLAVEYYWHEETKKVSISHRELNSPDQIDSYLDDSNTSRSEDRPTLRLIYASNAPWSLKQLEKRINMRTTTRYGTTQFSQYINPDREPGQHIEMDGLVFPAVNNRARGVVQGGFGFDYLHLYPHKKELSQSRTNSELTWDTWASWDRVVDSRGSANIIFPHSKLIELSDRDRNGNTRVVKDAFFRRLTMAVQLRHEDVQTSKLDQRLDPYRVEFTDRPTAHPKSTKDEYSTATTPLENLIVMFDTSTTNKVDLFSSLIPYRDPVESVWIDRIGQFDLYDFPSKRDFLLTMTNIVLQGSFNCLHMTWNKFIDQCDCQMVILHDRLYSQPDEPSRAGELWSNELYWTIVNRLDYIDRLVNGHAQLVREARAVLADMSGQAEDKWLEGAEESLIRARDRLDLILSKPMMNMNDLVHKLIQNRDAAVGVQLSDSMWWLSWITFIFLPLTFTSGVFGMNINWLENNPSGLFYIAVAIPFMSLIIGLWYVFKDVFFPDDRLAAAQRSEFERVYRELKTDHPGAWNVKGPDLGFHTGDGTMARLQARLLWFWYAPYKTVDAPLYGQTKTQLDWWSRTKCAILKKWVAMKTNKRGKVRMG